MTNKDTAEAKLELGRAKKVLWQYRNKDIDEFEYIEAIDYLIECAEQSKLQALREEIEDMEDYLLNTGSFGNTIVVSKDDVLNLIDNIE